MLPLGTLIGVSIDLANFFKSLKNMKIKNFSAYYSQRKPTAIGALLGRGCTKIERHRL